MHAALSDRLDIIQFLHENGCPLSVATPGYACLAGSLESLQYGHENECPWHERVAEVAATGTCQGYPPEYMDWSKHHIPPNAEKTRPKCLKYLVDNEFPGAQQYAHLLGSDGEE